MKNLRLVCVSGRDPKGEDGQSYRLASVVDSQNGPAGVTPILVYGCLSCSVFLVGHFSCPFCNGPIDLQGGL